jgi:hypothetical protein
MHVFCYTSDEAHKKNNLNNMLSRVLYLYDKTINIMEGMI